MRANHVELLLALQHFSLVRWALSASQRILSSFWQITYLRPHWERLHMPRLRPIHAILVRFGGAMAKGTCSLSGAVTSLGLRKSLVLTFGAPKVPTMPEAVLGWEKSARSPAD